jgi:hypothetical protein
MTKTNSNEEYEIYNELVDGTYIRYHEILDHLFFYYILFV